MKILHISSSDRGGAGRACIRLHDGLLAEGVESRALVFLKHDENREVYSFHNPGPLSKYYNYAKIGWHYSLNKLRLLGRKNDVEIFTSPKSLIRIEKHPLYDWADIIHLHWVAYMLDYRTFFKNNTKPVVWTLHDMNSFTGGCHYTFGCDKFMDVCRECPQLSGTSNHDYSKKLQEIKQKYLEIVENVFPVAPSEWMRQNSERSKILGHFKSIKINNGIDRQSFRLLDKIESRNEFKLPQDKIIISFVAEALDKNIRKGFGLLLDALPNIQSDKDFLFCTVGEFINKKPIQNLKSLGYINSIEKMNKLYCASDLFVLPSIEDNFPNTVLESLFSGTPVLGFDIGGVNEMIDDCKTGILCNEIGSYELSKKMQEFIEGKYQFDKNLIRKTAIDRFDLIIQSRKTIELYKKIMKKIIKRR